MTTLGQLPDKILVLGQTEDDFFFPSPKSSSEGLGTMISRSFSVDQKESCGGYILVAV